MTIDTRGAAEIEPSLVRMLSLAALGLILTAVLAAVALHVVLDVAPGSRLEFFGRAGTVFCAACTVLILWRAFAMRGPVVTITREGIRDRRVAAELIPWSAVNGIKVWEHRGQRTMVLAVDPTVEAGLSLTRTVRWTRDANRALGADGLCVTALGLKIGFDELLETSVAHARAWQSGAAAAPTHRDRDEDRGACAGRVGDRFAPRAPDPRERWDR
jgi:hypothetical protein